MLAFGAYLTAAIMVAYAGIEAAHNFKNIKADLKYMLFGKDED